MEKKLTLEWLTLESMMRTEEIPNDETLNKEQKLRDRSLRDIKANLVVNEQMDGEGLQVFAIALSRNSRDNYELHISCESGEALSADVYDIVKDQYHVYGCGFIDLGHIPVSFELQMDDALGWSVDVPCPLSVIRRYLSKEAKELLKEWTSQYPPDRYEIKFLQVRAGF